MRDNILRIMVLRLSKTMIRIQTDHLKVVFIQEFSRISRIKSFVNSKIKNL